MHLRLRLGQAAKYALRQTLGAVAYAGLFNQLNDLDQTTGFVVVRMVLVRMVMFVCMLVVMRVRVLVRMLIFVRVLVRMLMFVRVLVRMAMFVRVRVAMRMGMLVSVVSVVLMRMGMRIPMPVRMLVLLSMPVTSMAMLISAMNIASIGGVQRFTLVTIEHINLLAGDVAAHHIADAHHIAAFGQGELRKLASP